MTAEQTRQEVPRIAVTRMGALFHYAIPKAINRLGWLGQFYTDIWAAKTTWSPLHTIPHSFRPEGLRRFLGRSAEGLPSGMVTEFPLLTLKNLLQYRRVRNSAEMLQAHMAAGEHFCQCIIRHGLGDCNAVYTTNTQGLGLLIHARRNGLRTFMEQTIAPYSIEMQLIQEEQAQFPDWEKPIEQVGEAGAAYTELERQEWASSDRILCGSEFVRNAIRSAGGPVDRCVVVPYCYEPDTAPPERVRHTRRLRILTVGTVGLRKGLARVAQTAGQLRGQMDFRVVGPLRLASKGLAFLKNVVDLTGPVPRSEVLDHFKWADVFLLPSLCEGSATVCYEAMAMGLPVICTPNTGSKVQSGVDGFLVPIRNMEAIVEHLVQLDKNRDQLLELSHNAINRSKHCTMSDYCQRLAAAIQPKCSSNAKV